MVGERRPGIKTAFVAGAGLGKRLRPLTDERPKPLVPVFNRPLITYVFDRLIDVGIERVVVNTHHRSEQYHRVLGGQGGRLDYRSLEVIFIHEPVLLETAGGIRNAAHWFPDESVLVHNGDVLSSVNLAELLRRHQTSDCDVSLHLRRFGGPLQVRYDLHSERVVDIRGALEAVGESTVDCLFTGAYVLEPDFVQKIPPGEILSVIPMFLQMMTDGNGIGGVLDDSGVWADLGNRESYLNAHAEIPIADFSAWEVPFQSERMCIHPTAVVEAGVTFEGFVSVGAGVRIGEGARIRESILWNGAKIASGSELRRCIVRENGHASGSLINQDI